MDGLSRLSLFLPLLIWVGDSFAGGSVAVWKYSGDDFRSVSFANLSKGEHSWYRSASVFVDASGNYRYSPYSSIYGKVEPSRPRDWHSTNPVLAEIAASGGEGEKKICDLLLLNQAYPMAQMIARKVLDESLSGELLRSSLKFDPDQVTFIESTDVFAEPIVRRKNAGQIPKNSRETENPYTRVEGMTRGEWTTYHNAFFREDDARTADEILKEERAHRNLLAKEERQRSRKYYEVKMASLWLISGQTPNGLRSLPFQGHSSQILERTLDRREFPHVWEIGRVAQTEKGHFLKVIEAALLQIQSEAALLGIDLEKAYLFGHALDTLHVRLYQNTFGLQKFSGYVGDAEGMVLYSSVADMLRKLGLTKTKVENVPLKAERMIDQLAKVDRVVQSMPGGSAKFRDFSQKKSRKEWVAPPLSLDERVAANKGARNTQGGFFGQEQRYDGLDWRMRKFYEGIERPGQSGRRYADPMVEDYYLRARYEELDAWVIDAPYGLEPHENEALRSLHAAVERTSGSAPPTNVAIVMRGYTPEAWKHRFALLGAQEEVVYFDPVITHGTRSGFFSRQYTTGGDSMTLYWFPYAKLKSAIAAGEIPVGAEFNSALDQKPKSLSETHWGDPLAGT